MAFSFFHLLYLKSEPHVLPHRKHFSFIFTQLHMAFSFFHLLYLQSEPHVLPHQKHFSALSGSGRSTLGTSCTSTPWQGCDLAEWRWGILLSLSVSSSSPDPPSDPFLCPLRAPVQLDSGASPLLSTFASHSHSL